MERCVKGKLAAEKMKITAPDLKELHVIDEIIPEVKGGAHKDMALEAEAIHHALVQSLKELLALTEEELIANRYEKYKQIGEYAVQTDNEYISTTYK